MKTNIRTSVNTNTIRQYVLACLLAIFSPAPLWAQMQQTQITGKILNAGTGQTIPFANIALYNETGTVQVTGTSSNLEGEFSIGGLDSGHYQLWISALGYDRLEKQVVVKTGSLLMLDSILLTAREIQLEEVLVEADRVKALESNGVTTYLVNQSMVDASNNGTDILRIIPGVHVDFRQEISLYGSRDILILVDGVERDRQFIQQLQAGQIDKVEVIANPPAIYNSNVTGVLNIQLVKKTQRGLDGHIYLEIPTSLSEVYSFPTYSLHYSIDRLNIFTSYNGELSYFNIQESQSRKIFHETGMREITTTQFVKQENWSHRYHYGFDYFINDRNQMNFYGFHNPYAQEHSGHVVMETSGFDTDHWVAKKTDDDRNLTNYYSLYYKHFFNETPGHELTCEANYQDLRADNSIRYVNEDNNHSRDNMTKPRQQSYGFKLDYQLPIYEPLRLNAGIQSRKQQMKDLNRETFTYTNRVMSAYGSFSYSTPLLDARAGIRYETSSSGNANNREPGNSVSALLPEANLQIKLPSARNIHISYRQSVGYPHIYQLSPMVSVHDPYSKHSGNPDLRPVFRQLAGLGYSKRFENNYISTRLFYSLNSDVINYLTFINEDRLFETRTMNLGDIHRYGIQLTGALRITKTVHFNPYISVFNIHTKPNSMAQNMNIVSRRQAGLDAGFSLFATFRHEITASAMFQYASTANNIQDNTYSDALYVLSCNKAFSRGLTIGIMSTVPLTGRFIYQGSAIDSTDFYSRSEGHIQISMMPLFITLKYRVSAGAGRSKINRSVEDIEQLPRRGF